MKCPKCGQKLRPSKKNPDRLLCDNCRKGFNRADLEDDYDDYDYAPVTANKPKKKLGALKITGIAVGALVVIAIIGSALGGGETTDNSTEPPAVSNTTTEPQEEQTEDVQTDEPEAEPETEPDVPTEYKSALTKAESYSEMMHMSKQGIYDQLTSEYGEQFSADAAQYAIDNLDADYKANALEKAKEYQETMSMSPEAIRDQLTSEYGEQFTQEEADYAVENLP